MSYFILDGENISEIAVESIGPDVTAVPAVDELSGDANARGRFSHAAFKDEIDLEVLRDLLHIHRFALVSEDGVAGDDEQPRDLGKIGDDVFTDPVTEIFLLGIAAHINKGENSDGWTFLPGHRCAAARRPIQQD